MKQNNTLSEIKKRALPVLRKAGIKRAAIFGSYARGEQKKKSDLDILVELPKGMSLLGLVELEDNLKGVLKKKVDLITYKSIHPLLEDSILEDQIPIL